MPCPPRRTAMLLACALAMGLSTASTARATDFHVDGQRGLDVASGGTQAQPWKTIRYALGRITSPATGFHRVLVAGGQDYRFDASILLRDRIFVVGNGAQKPRFVAGTAPIFFEVNTQNPGGEYAVLNCRFRGGRIAVNVGTAATRAQRLSIVDCDFESMLGAAVRTVLVAGSLQVEMRACTASFSQHGLSIDARGPARVAVTVSGSSFLNTSADAILMRSSAASSVRATLRTSRFNFCSRAVTLNSASGVPSMLELRNSSFRDNFQHGVGVIANAGAVSIDVLENSFLRDDSAIVVLSQNAKQDCSLRVRDNIVESAKRGGLNVSLEATSTSAKAWRVTTTRNLWQRCDSNYIVQTRGSLTGSWTADGDRSHMSRAESMDLLLGANAFATTLVNVMLTRGASGLRVGGTAALRGSSLMIADHARGAAIDASRSTGAMRFDHVALDNSANPEIVRNASFQLTHACSRSTLHAGVGNIRGDPAFVRPQYKLAPSSACIDAGLASFAGLATVDYEGDARVVTVRANRIDVGADEFRSSGSTRPYGAPSYGIRNGLVPRVDLLADTARIGSNVPLGLKGAIDGSGTRALAALVFFGLGEADPLVDFDPLGGAEGCVLYFGPLTVPQAVLVDAQGKARDVLPIPNAPSLVGGVFSAQWWVLHANANRLGFTFSEGIRLQVGR